MADEKHPIDALVEAYKTSIYQKDIDGFRALYDTDVLVFDLWATWSYQGALAWGGVARDWFGALGDERVAVGFEDIRLIDGSDMAMVHGTVTYRGISADGVVLRSVQNRLTWVLKRRGEGWKIIHEHTSTPVDPETMAAIIRMT